MLTTLKYKAGTCSPRTYHNRHCNSCSSSMHAHASPETMQKPDKQPSLHITRTEMDGNAADSIVGVKLAASKLPGIVLSPPTTPSSPSQDVTRTELFRVHPETPTVAKASDCTSKMIINIQGLPEPLQITVTGTKGSQHPASDTSTVSAPAATTSLPLPSGLISTAAMSTGLASPKLVPSNPLTLDDLLPLLTSDKRTSSIISDPLTDLYHQYIRHGSGSFPAPLSLNPSFRQDSLISGLGRLNSGLGSGCGFMQSPKSGHHLISPTPLDRQVSWLTGGLGVPPGFVRTESLGSQATAGFSPSLAGHVLPGQEDQAVRTFAGPPGWAHWPAQSASTAPAAPAAAIGLAGQQQPTQLDMAPSMHAWLPLSSNSANAAAVADDNALPSSQQHLLHQHQHAAQQVGSSGELGASAHGPVLASAAAILHAPCASMTTMMNGVTLPDGNESLQTQHELINEIRNMEAHPGLPSAQDGTAPADAAVRATDQPWLPHRTKDTATAAAAKGADLGGAVAGFAQQLSSDSSDDDSSDSGDDAAEHLARLQAAAAQMQQQQQLQQQVILSGYMPGAPGLNMLPHMAGQQPYQQQQQQLYSVFPAPLAQHGRFSHDGTGFTVQGPNAAATGGQYGQAGMMSTNMQVTNISDMVLMGEASATPWQPPATAGAGGVAAHPTLFVPVAATGRHGSGLSDSTAHWSAAAGGGGGAFRSGSSSAHASPDQPPPFAAAAAWTEAPQQMQQQQQQYIAMDSYNRVVVDPTSAAVTMYPRTKRRRWSTAADAPTQPRHADQAMPDGAAMIQRPDIQQQTSAAYLKGQQQLRNLQQWQAQQQQQHHQQPAAYPGETAAAAAAVFTQESMPGQLAKHSQQLGSTNADADTVVAGTMQYVLAASASAVQQPEMQEHEIAAASGGSIAVSRPRRKIRPTAAAAAMMEAADNGDDDQHASQVNKSAARGGRRTTAAAAAVAAVADTDHDGRQESDGYSASEVASDDESDADSGMVSEEYESEGRRKRGRRPHNKQHSSKAARAGPGRVQAGAVRRRTAAASAAKQSSPASSPSSGAAAGRPLIEDTRSQYKGVTRHRRSGRWEAHIWVKELGRQVYLGGYELEEAAAEAYDMAALKCKGQGCATNFPCERYADLMGSLSSMTLEELIMAVRRQSQGFSRGSSNYRGVTAHPSGRWESRIGIPGSRHVYLGLYGEEQEAARAYDGALVRLKGLTAATNFSLASYQAQLAEHYQLRMAVDEGTVPSQLCKKNSGPEFEQWIKMGIASFGIEVSQKAKDMARADTGPADADGNRAAVASPVLLRMNSVKTQ